MTFELRRRLFAEWIGTAALLATVVGSGIMAETLAGGNVAIALLGNAIAAGAILFVLITALGPISGAHFNPAVTFAFALRRDIPAAQAAAYVGVQIIGAVCGVILAHLMFELPWLNVSENVRTGPSQWLAEMVATFGLLATIFACVRFKPDAVPLAVGLFITAGYWFTASTSFANPAVTFARCLTNTFSGIRPEDAPAFIVAQFVAAALATVVFAWLLKPQSTDA